MKAIVVGGTGLVGSHLLSQLAKKSQFQAVMSLQRSQKVGFPETIKQLEIDFEKLEQEAPEGPFDAAFCCLGTTIKKAGSKSAFEKVDYEYVMRFAKWAKQNGVRHFAVVSALGANENSSFFYSRVKGKVEQELEALNFHSLGIFQPSLLLGKRKEFRFGEKVGEFFIQLLRPLLIGPLRKYRAIKAKTVAKAMVNYTLRNPQGLRIYPSDQIRILAKIDLYANT